LNGSRVNYASHWSVIVKVEVLHPSSSDGFRMTGKGGAGDGAAAWERERARYIVPLRGRAAGAKKQQIPPDKARDSRPSSSARRRARSRKKPSGMQGAQMTSGGGQMFPVTVPVLEFSHDPSTARPDPSATLRAGVQTTHAENASGRSAQDDRQGRRRRQTRRNSRSLAALGMTFSEVGRCQVPGAGEKLS